MVVSGFVFSKYEISAFFRFSTDVIGEVRDLEPFYLPDFKVWFLFDKIEIGPG